MKPSQKLVIIFSLLLCSLQVLRAQNNHNATVSGKIKAASGEVLAGVTVMLKNTDFGTITDSEGRFEIPHIPSGSYTLLTSFIGFESQEKTIQLGPSQSLQLDFVLVEKTFEMEGVQITGKSITERINEQAYAVTAINAKEMHNSTSDAKVILNRISGVRIIEEGGLGSNLNFSLNGFSGDQVKFFLDGIPMDNFGSSFNLGNIPVNTIDRIEVYKGVVPVWLGTDALGGAVNIITNKNNNYLDASYSFGSFNTHRISLNGAYTNNKNGFTFRGNTNYNYSDNNYKVWVPIKRGNNIENFAEVERFHDRYKSGTVKFETGLVKRKYADNLLIGIIASGDDKQVQTGATMNSVYGGILRNSRSVIPTFKYNKADLFIDGLSVSLSSAYNGTRSRYIDTLRGVTFNWLGERTHNPQSNDGELSRRSFLTLNDRELTTQFNTSYFVTPHHSFVLNYSYSYFIRKAFDRENPDRIENRFPKNLTKQVLGLAYKFDPTRKWSTTIFGKFYILKAETDKEFDFGLDTRRVEAIVSNKDNFGYGIASSYYIIPDLQLKASYEHTYRMPWPDEIFGDGLFTDPNPDLDPEQSDNFNAGAAYSFEVKSHHAFNIEGSFIYRKAKDLIYQVVKVASPKTSYSNLDETQALGVEGSFKYQWRKTLTIGGNVTFQNITDQADSVYNESYTHSGYQPNFQKGFRLPNTPYLFGNANVGYTFKNVLMKESTLNLNYYLTFVEQYFLSWAEYGSEDDKKIIPRQNAHNAEITYSLSNGKYNIALECRNIADALLYDKYYLQKPGRAFYLKLRYVPGF